MTKSNELQQQIDDYQAKLNELRKQQEAERKGERTQAIISAKELIKTYDLTASDLGFSGKGAAKKVTGDKRNVVAPKYQDPDSGKTWTGRGKSPAWLSAQLATGRDKQEFLIQH
ncbi:H-NS histone family protein [Polaromonas naphthalenivorans]|uniref:Histone family protein nucleoid-structuring protein H-NS n=1 Tax=Polaromonas naphthalenivorans (strain CJ2) TaxID=365044 RepID=A1VT12_POLNA|nr:H-NS histone family protein [Polaromonas naphthalenivorans]ABM38790.1 histone family protein nucleoid-structuring protein H-NS [Polaromonas naphthalenivorans CJ2]